MASKKQISVVVSFLDSDSFDVNAEVIPCDSEETAKAVVKRVVDLVIKNAQEDSYYGFEIDNEDELKEAKENFKDWVSSIKINEDGGTHIDGGDSGGIDITIKKNKVVTQDSVKDLEIPFHAYY